MLATNKVVYSAVMFYASLVVTYYSSPVIQYEITKWETERKIVCSRFDLHIHMYIGFLRTFEMLRATNEFNTSKQRYPAG